jgi:hypothetical protein
MAGKSTVKRRPKLEDLPPLLSLPQVAAFLGRSPMWCHDNLDREACVLRVGGGRVLPLFRQGREWRAWRTDLAALFGEAA